MSIPQRMLGKTRRELPVLGMEGESDVQADLHLGGPKWPILPGEPRSFLEGLPEQPAEGVVVRYPDLSVLKAGRMLDVLKVKKREGHYSLVGLLAASVDQARLAFHLDIFDFLVMVYNPFESQIGNELLFQTQAHGIGVIVLDPTGLEPSPWKSQRQLFWEEMQADFPDLRGHVPWLALQFCLQHPGVTAVCPQVKSNFEWHEWRQGLLLPPMTEGQVRSLRRRALGLPP